MLQLSVQVVRRLGYQKILQYFDSLDKFDEKLLSVDSRIYDNDDVIYSVPKKWYKIDAEALKNNYSGFFNFVNYCEPMLGFIKPTEGIQRRFRNTWNSIWDNFAGDCDISKVDLKRYKTLGVRLVYLCGCNIDLNVDEQAVVGFFDSVIKWGIFVKQELSVESDDIVLDVLEKFTLLNQEEFIEYVKELV